MSEPEPTAGGTCRCNTQRWTIVGKCSCPPRVPAESPWEREQREKSEAHRALLSIADSLVIIARVLESRGVP